MFSEGRGCFITSAVHGKDKPSAAAVIPEFTEVDSLPCTQVQAPSGYGNRQAGPEKRGLDMGGHIIVHVF